MCKPHMPCFKQISGNSYINKRRWCSGIMQDSHSCDPGSIPGRRIFTLFTSFFLGGLGADVFLALSQSCTQFFVDHQSQSFLGFKWSNLHKLPLLSSF